VRTLNLGILAHVDAGKTSLTERLLHSAGVIAEIGSVDAGSTQTDSLALERQRGITIKSAVVSFAVGDVTVNLIDTPGHPDFIAEVQRVLGVLDGTDVLFVDRVRSFRRGVDETGLDLHTGSRLPAYCTAMGKLLLANLPESEQREPITQMKLTKRGPNTITGKRALMDELDTLHPYGQGNAEPVFGLRQ